MKFKAFAAQYHIGQNRRDAIKKTNHQHTRFIKNVSIFSKIYGVENREM